MGLVKKGGDALSKLRAQRENRERFESADAMAKEALVLVIDTSISMSEPASPKSSRPTRLQAVRDAAQDLIRASFQSRIAVLSFAEHYEDHTEGLVSRLKAEEALAHLHVRGGTLLNEALAGIEHVLDHREDPVRRGIILTDGVDCHGVGFDKADRDYIDSSSVMLRFLKGAGIVVDCIGFGADADEERLKQISSATGGVYSHADDPGSLRREFLRLEAGVRGLLTGGG